MSKSKRILSFIMALSMLLTMFSGMGSVFASAETETGYTGSESVIDSIASLEAGSYKSGNYLYLGIDFYEKNAAGEWEITDHYVNPGDTLRGYFYLKSNLYIGAGAPYFVFERSFFDVTNAQKALSYDNTYDPNKTDYPTENYPGNIANTVGTYAVINDSHPTVADNGLTFNYTTKWARNIPGFTEVAQTNWHGVPLTESDTWDFWYASWKRDTSTTNALLFDSDEYFYTFDVKVREFMPDGVTKLPDGKTGFVKLDKRVMTIWDNERDAGQNVKSNRASNISTFNEFTQYSKTKALNQATWLTIDDFLVDDCSHTFTIGANPDNVPQFGESQIKDMATLNAGTYKSGNFLYLGIDFYEMDPSTGEWNYTDHYVNPGDTLRGYFYLKSNLYIGAGAPYFVFERSFFDVTNAQKALSYDNTYDPNKTDYPTENYPGNIANTVGTYAVINDSHPTVADNGLTFNYTTKWARNIPGFTEVAQTNWHGVPLTESDTWDFWYASWKRDTSTTNALLFDSDEYFYTFDVKVREFMPDGVTKLPDGKTGFVKLDKRVMTIWDNERDAGQNVKSNRASNISTFNEFTQYSKTKALNQATWLTIDDFLVDDCSHTFTIGKPSAGGKEYTATFTVDGETYGEAVKAKKGAEIAAPATAPVKAGYTFAGWALEGTTDVLTFPQTMGDADVTYVAIFTALPKYTATFYADGVQVGTAAEYYEGEQIVAPTAPTKTGYTFVEWEPEVGVMGTSNVVFNAVYAAKTYTVTWIANGATHDTTSVDYDAAYALPAAPSKEGSTFAGWYADASFTTPIADVHKVDGNVTFYAKFTTNTYTITFDTAGGSAIADAEYAFGATVVAPEAPTKAGYTFAGWSPALPATMPANNITVVAQWTAVASGVFFYDGDQLVKEIEGVYGQVITADQAPAMAKDGFTFAGWEDASGNAVAFPQTLGTSALTVYAKWNAKSYYIEFYNGDQWIDGTNQLCGNAIVTPEAPTKTGYTFVGWVDAEGNEMPATVPAAPEGTTGFIYYAKFEATLYNAVFMNGDEVHATVTGAYQSAINAPEVPKKEGHTFKYWVKQGTTAKVNFPAKMPINGITYVAQYDVNEYVITYYVDGAKVFEETLAYGAAITPYDYKPAEGVTFSGWGDQVPATMPAKNVDVYATTGIANYTVTFTVNGEEYATVDFAYGAAVTAPAYDIPAGHSFSGWDVPATMPAQNITLDATLSINSYWARWYLDAEKTILYHEELVEFGAEIEFPEDPTEADIPGHTFDIWDDDTVTTMVEGGVDYVAITTPIPYAVEFLNEDGSLVDGYDWIAYYGDVVTAEDAPVLTKEGFQFKGWEVNGERVTLPYTITGPVSFKAVFGVESYDVIWVVDGKVLYTDSYDFNDAITMRADEVKEGYTFSGWDKDLTGMNMPAENITVTGSFTVNQYDAIFYAEDVLLATVPTNFGEVPVAPTAPEKTGYAFIGWAPTLAPMVVAPEGVRYDAVYSAGSVAYKVEIYTMDTEGNYGAPEVLDFAANADADISYAPAAKTGFTVDAASVLEGKAAADGSTVLTVYYIRDQFTFATVIDGETTAVKYYYGEEVVAPAEPSKTGYRFLGWDNTIPATMPARDVTLTARFQINQYTITYNTDGGTLIPSVTADYGTAVTAPAAPTKTGYTFNGWDVQIPATIPAENITITAQWTINQYTITFVDTGDASYAPITLDYNAPVATIADPVKTGYTFTGWDVAIPENMPAKDMTITATWKVNQYDAIFVINGAETVVATNYNEVPVAPEAVKYGYTFKGWDKDLAPMGTEAVTYTAIFEANTYDAIFDADGGKWADGDATKIAATVFDVAIVPPAENPTREGYIFDRWEPTVGNMTVEGGMTFKAIWKQDLNFCRVQSVERITENVYGPQLAQYEIKVMGSPVKLQIAYADATNVTWTFDRNDTKVAADAAGLVSIKAYNEAGVEVAVGAADTNYEVWTISTTLTDDDYKVRAKVDYTSSSWESLDFAYDYTMEYDEAQAAGTTMVYSVESSVATIKRGKTGVITVVTDASVTRLQLKMQKADGTYTTVTYAPTSSAVSYDETTYAAENKTVWAITVTFTYAGTADSQDQVWAAFYRTSLGSWIDAEKAVTVKVTRTETAPVETPSGAPAYSVISAEIAQPSIKVATEATITVVTTNDITRVRLNNTDLGKTATYLKTSKNVVVTEDAAAGTLTWTITYRFGVVSENQQWYVQCRGTSWSALDKYITVTVTE